MVTDKASFTICKTHLAQTKQNKTRLLATNDLQVSSLILFRFPMMVDSGLGLIKAQISGQCKVPNELDSF